MTTLEKIRAEIEKIEPLDYPCDKRTPERIRDMALDIIDKYAYQEPKQPDICPIYDGMCGYPIEFCYECPRHPKQEPCEDAISREELLKAINTWDKFGYTETGCFVREPKGDYVPYIHYDDVVKAIKGMPSVQPKKTGHWIKSRDCYGNNHFTCSECGNDIATQYADSWDDKYCSECGCRMVEPRESED